MSPSGTARGVAGGSLRWRGVLGAALAGSALGCLDEAPTFSPRGQRPPFVIAGQVEPSMGAIYEGPIPIPINVPFRSEDVNIPLEARLYLDLTPGGDNVLTVQKEVPPGIYEDTRSVSMSWSTDVDGCHSLTMILTYYDNFVPGGTKDDTLAARVVWWLNVGDVEGDVTMASCPGSSQRAVQ